MIPPRFLPLAVLAAGAAWAQPKLAPTTDQPLGGAGHSVVHSPTLQLAWDRLTNAVGGPVAMERPAPLLARLNRGSCPAGVVPPDAHLSVAGISTRQARAKLERTLEARFGRDAPVLPRALYGRDALFAYAHLHRQLAFRRPMIPAKKPLPFRVGKATRLVKAFGIPPNKADGYPLRIPHYAGPDEFTLVVATVRTNEAIVLAKMPTPANLTTAVSRVRAQLEAERAPFVEMEIGGREHMFMDELFFGDSVVIPEIDLDIEQDFADLTGRRLANRRFAGKTLKVAHQQVEFRLDHDGAAVRSTANIVEFGGSSKPRAFKFDKPFLVSLWVRGAPQPYLAVWVASPDVLVPVGR